LLSEAGSRTWSEAGWLVALVAAAVFAGSRCVGLPHASVDRGISPVSSHVLGEKELTTGKDGVSASVSAHGAAQQGLTTAHTARPAESLEDEYVWLLIQAVTRGDRRLPRPEAYATRRQVQQWLEVLAQSPEYRSIVRGSGRQWWGLLCGRLDPQHAYSYCPPRRSPGESLGVLVFLHGHGLNYLFVLHALRPLCDQLRLMVLMPSFGYGNWEAPGGVEAILRAVDFGISHGGADPRRVLLGGLSQGGAGVSRAAAEQPSRFAGLVFISATMELSVIGSPEFAAGWKGRPVLVIQGERDANVRPASVTAATQQMIADGVQVTAYRDPHAGHFLFFAKPAELTGLVMRWARPIVQFSST
jgi:pimeloyl-ACP methyl ester carboxylesterase